MLDRISLDKQNAESSLLRTDGTVLRLTPGARPRGEWFHGEFVGNLCHHHCHPAKGGAGVANGYAIEGISVGRVECTLPQRPETPRFTAAPLLAATKTSLTAPVPTS
jgi:hypothetical protein